jgi:hypothetical protein
VSSEQCMVNGGQFTAHCSLFTAHYSQLLDFAHDVKLDKAGVLVGF